MNKDEVNFIRDDLEFSALQYARLKCFQFHREDQSANASNIIVNQSEVKDLMGYYSKKMTFHAEQLLRALESELPERKS